VKTKPIAGQKRGEGKNFAKDNLRSLGNRQKGGVRRVTNYSKEGKRCLLRSRHLQHTQKVEGKRKATGQERGGSMSRSRGVVKIDEKGEKP